MDHARSPAITHIKAAKPSSHHASFSLTTTTTSPPPLVSSSLTERELADIAASHPPDFTGIHLGSDHLRSIMTSTSKYSLLQPLIVGHQSKAERDPSPYSDSPASSFSSPGSSLGSCPADTDSPSTPPSTVSNSPWSTRPKRPSGLRRDSSYLKHLNLNATLDKERFGLGDLRIVTGTTAYTQSDHLLDLQVNIAEMSSDMSKSDTIRASSSAYTGTGTGAAAGGSSGGRTPTSALQPVSRSVSSGSRQRQPPPPSPLSRIESGRPTDIPNGSAPQSPPRSHIPEASPCFIHSHLDKRGSGSLQEWLKNRTNDSPDQEPPHSNSNKPHHRSNGPKSASHVSSPARPNHTNTSLLPSVSDTNVSRVTSPIGNGARPPLSTSGSGYDSDRSSQVGGSTILDGDFIDDEEDGGSLTRQLAETAQGVREMSKELGRTRVRSRIQHILIVTKARDNRLIKLTRELALYLMQKKPAPSSEAPVRPNSTERGMVVYVDAQLRNSKRFDAAGLQRDHPELFQPVGRRRSSSSASVNNMSAWPSSTSLSEAGRKKDEGQLRYWTAEMCSNSSQLFDFVITLGGDGTVLFTSWLFQRIVPPVLPFALGSLGFLTNFDFAQYKQTMDRVIDDGIRVNLRMRFTCTVYRAIAPEEAEDALSKGKKRKAIKKAGGEILMSQVDKGGWEALECPGGSSSEVQKCVEGKDKEIMCFSTRPVEQFEVLNDLVVDRGPSPYVSLLELFGDEHHLTTVQADGLTVSTPTGSTAYSLSAGGSLVHPQIPAILITPICPHTLSFRPMLLPDSMELRICVPYNSRSTAWASFDGRGRVELKQGDHIKVTASKYPFPTVSADKASTDWFSSISRTLRWNEREKQKSFVVVEEDNEPSGTSGAQRQRSSNPAKKDTRAEDSVKEEQEDEQEEEEEEDEDEFDIDDKSGGEQTKPSSPNNSEGGHTQNPIPKSVNRIQESTHRKSGVYTPDRYATHYGGPPPLSQRHLVEALVAAEIDNKEGEVGQRDEIRAGPSELRVDGGAHLIPSGRSVISSSQGDSQSSGGRHEHALAELKTPRPKGLGRDGRQSGHSPHRRKKEECKAKAFAFFGQDDSASDLSDNQSE